MVSEWGGTKAQLTCNITLREAARDDIPTLSDINAAFDNTTSTAIIAEHIKSVVAYSDVMISPAQLAETAFSILVNYYYLNLAELCIFFKELKGGSRFQVVWGSKLNNQELMVALNKFAADRRTERSKLEIEKAKEYAKSCHTRIEAAASAVIAGINDFKKQKAEAKKNIIAFKTIFPAIPEGYSYETLWKAWRGSKSAIKEIFGGDVPPRKASNCIGKWLCDYNVRKFKSA